MKKYCLMLLMAGLLGGTSAHAQKYFVQNYGFDSQDPISQTLTSSADAAAVDGTSFAPWRTYTVAGHSATFEVKAEPTAPSAPNVFEFSTSGGAWLNEVLDMYDNKPLNMSVGRMYKLSFWARSMDGTDHMFSVLGFHKANGEWNGPPQLQTGHSLTADWQRFEIPFTLPDGTAGANPQFGCDTPDWDIQMDSIQLEDITYTNRILNSGFENSPTSIPSWIVSTAGGNDYSAAVVTNDCAEGKQAIKVMQTNTPDGSDGVISSVLLPWNGSDQMKLTFKLKDVTGLSANDYAQIFVPAFDADGNFLGVNAGAKIAKPGNGSWATVEDVVTDLPAGTKQVQIAIRITDAAGTRIPGDFLLDDFSATDTSQVKADDSKTMNAAKRTITVDGNAADWDLTASQPIHMTNPATKYADHPMQIDMRYAWDADYLYLLIQESGDSPVKNEAADGGAFVSDGPWSYDCISPWINLDAANLTPNDAGFNPWLGFSSSGQTDLLCARVDGAIKAAANTMNDAVLAGAQVATSGNQAQHNRTIEARFKWSSIASAVPGGYQPNGGLLAAVKPGYKLGVDPLMVQENYTAQCFMNSVVGAPPSGTDQYSRYIILTDAVPVELSSFSLE